MKTFIRATEVWVPGRDRATLELGSGMHGAATRFAAASQASSFANGEGLPGKAWKEGRPVILQRFEGSCFQRTGAALADGYCGSTGDAFETVSRALSLRRGNGLPGLAWERDGPVFMADLGKGAGFLRADSATRVGINRGFAFPCPGNSP